MNLDISINTNYNCKVVLTDNSEYLSESSGTSKGSFKHSDISSISVLLHNKTSETVIKKPIFETGSEVVLPVNFDGWFTVNYIVLPNKEWFNRELEKSSGSALGLYKIVYYSDGNHIYKYINSTIEEVTLEEILEVNPTDTTLSKTSKDYISICFLQKCYIDLCKLIFKERGFSPCGDKTNLDKQLIYKRDLLWMAINVIKYLTEFNQLAEVLRIVEQITSCNGLCNFNSTYLSSSSGCGCSK